MGLRFNTDGTVEILRILNAHYRDAAFVAAKTQPVDPNVFERDIYLDYTNYVDLCAVVRKLGLVPKQYAYAAPRWEQWLKDLDKLNQGGKTGGVLVRDAIANALDPNNPNCIAIEFFACPSANFQVLFPPPIYESNKTNFAVCITVETPTVDNIAAYFRANKSKVAKKARPAAGRGRSSAKA
jgi:hypothetical protein